MKKRTLISIETDRIVVIQHRRHKRHGWCTESKAEDNGPSQYDNGACSIDHLLESEVFVDDEAEQSLATLRWKLGGG